MFPVTNGVMGGVQMILINLIPYLADNELYKIRLYDYNDGVVKTKIFGDYPSINIDFIELDGCDLFIPNKGDETFVLFGFQFIRYGLLFKNKSGVKILNWDVFYPQWSNIDTIKGFKIPGVGKMICNLLSQNNSQIFMELNGLKEFSRYDNNISISNIVPVPVPMKKKFTVRKFSKNKPIHIGYIGRAVDWKIFPLVHFVHDMKRIGVSFKLSVFTNDSLPFEKALDGFYETNVKYIVGKSGFELEGLLLDIDLGFSMGTAALDFARNSIPTILADFGYKKFPLEYKYRWLFNSDRGNLGNDVFSKFYDPKNGQDLSEIFEQLSSSYEYMAERCFLYVKKHHSIESVSSVFLDNIKNTTLTPKLLIKPWFLFKCGMYYIRAKFFPSEVTKNGLWSN